MNDFLHCLGNLLFFDVPLLYYYTDLNLPINCCLSSRDKYLSFGISFSFLASSKFFCDDFLETLFILLAFLLPIKSPVSSTVF